MNAKKGLIAVLLVALAACSGQSRGWETHNERQADDKSATAVAASEVYDDPVPPPLPGAPLPPPRGWKVASGKVVKCDPVVAQVSADDEEPLPPPKPGAPLPPTKPAAPAVQADPAPTPPEAQVVVSAPPADPVPDPAVAQQPAPPPVAVVGADGTPTPNADVVALATDVDRRFAEEASKRIEVAKRLETAEKALEELKAKAVVAPAPVVVAPSPTPPTPVAPLDPLEFKYAKMIAAYDMPGGRGVALAKAWACQLGPTFTDEVEKRRPDLSGWFKKVTGATL